MFSVCLIVLVGYDLDVVLLFWELLCKCIDYGIFVDGMYFGWCKCIVVLVVVVVMVKEVVL